MRLHCEQCCTHLGPVWLWSWLQSYSISLSMFVVFLLFMSLGHAQDPSGTTYPLTSNETVQRNLPASDGPSADTLSYHTYIVTLNASVGELTIQVDGGDDDVDLVTQPGAIIERFADASYQGLDTSPQHSFTYLNPPLGEIFIDVVNKTDAPVNYTLMVTARDVASLASPPATETTTEDIDAATADSTSPVEPEVSTEDTTTEDANNDASDTSSNDEAVDVSNLTPEPTGTYGALELGETVTRKIVSASASNGLAYHVYILDVPEDSPNITISVRGEDGVNIDMVTNADEPVTRYSEADFNGVGPNTSEQVSYADASGARIYIDVVNRQNAPLTYTLQVSPELRAGNIVRAGVLEQGELAQANDITETTLPEAMSSDDVLANGTYGVIPIGNGVTANIGPAGSAGFSYNTYLIEVTEPLDDLTIDLRSLGNDPDAIDLVVQRGALIQDYDNADYNSFGPRPPSFTYNNPQAAVVYYVDVVNLGSQVVPYELRVSSTGFMVSSAQASDPEAAEAAEFVAPSRNSSMVTELILGKRQHVYGELTGKSAVATFHTYTVEIPAGINSFEIDLSASLDLDLAAQFDELISNYLATSVYFANSLRTQEHLQIDNPTAGRWYIDVVNSLGQGADSSYSLTITVR